MAENPTHHQHQEQQGREEPGAGWLASDRGEGGGCFSCQDAGDKWPTSSSLSAVPTLHTERQGGRAFPGPGRKGKDREGNTAVMWRRERMRPLNACRE